jgi:thiamine biosynthesis lipoprotein
MGTTARVKVWADDEAVRDRAISDAFSALHIVDDEMSTYKPESQISVLNREGSSRWVQIGPGLAEVLGASIRFGRISNGAFDPTVLPLMVLWGFRGGVPRLPADSEIRGVLAVTGLTHLELDTERYRARLTKPGVSLDLGGIAKGYALDRAQTAAREAGAEAGIIDLGGNIVSFGEQAAGQIAIQHPLIPDGILGSIPLRERAIATSGGYEKYVTIDGRRYGHILDPRTGRPTRDVESVTVVAESGMTADALSTACFVLGPEACLELVSRQERTACVVAWIQADTLTVASSPGLYLSD